MEGDQEKGELSLLAIFGDLIVGVGSRILLAHAFPGSDVWEDWVPWEETPVQDYLESLPKEMAPVDPILTGPLPEVSPDIPVSDFLLPVVGLGRVFNFQAAAVARMIDVDGSLLKDWLKGSAIPQGEQRKKLALLGSLYERLAYRFDGKPVKEFHEWMATPLEALGKRSPAQALLDGNAAAVVRLLILSSMGKSK